MPGDGLAHLLAQVHARRVTAAAGSGRMGRCANLALRRDEL